MSKVIAEDSNLVAWDGAVTAGTSKLADEVVTVEPTPAAREMMSNPHWAKVIRRALEDSEAGRIRTLDEHRQSL